MLTKKPLSNDFPPTLPSDRPSGVKLSYTEARSRPLNFVAKRNIRSLESLSAWSDRPVSAKANVTSFRQYKQNVNIFTWGFTTFVELLLNRFGILVNKFLAPTKAAHWGKEGSGIAGSQSPKDLDAIAHAAIAEDLQKQINCLAPALAVANAIVQRMLNFCEAIAMHMHSDCNCSICKFMRGMTLCLVLL